MYPIQEQQWGQVNIHTWGDLSPHQWMCFRATLAEVISEQQAQGVKVDYSKTVNEVITEVEVQGVRVDFSPTVMRIITEMIVNIVVSRRDYKSAMLEYLPWYERKSVVFDEILNAYDKEFRRVEQSLDVVDRNMLLDTAIEMLHIYEKDLGIQTRKDLKYDQRREQISSRYIASFDQTTEDTIKAVAQAYSNGEVEVNPTDVDGMYEIKFIGTKGIPSNIEGLKEALDIVIPAHLGLTYTFTYNPWEFVSQMTWGKVADMTWNDLRVWREVS